jgi:hypothetical protein
MERTINQPWTQVVLEGLRRLDEGIVPPPAFPPEYEKTPSEMPNTTELPGSDLEQLRVPGFLSFISKESIGKRRFIGGAVAVVVIMTVAAIGVPAGWYGPRVTSAVVSQPVPTNAPVETPVVSEAPPTLQADPLVEDPAAATAAKRQRESKIKAREEKAATANAVAPSQTQAPPTVAAVNTAKSGPKKVTVTVTYDESGRVTQASGGDPTAIRIARQKRFPAGKPGSATVTIPIN